MFFHVYEPSIKAYSAKTLRNGGIGFTLDLVVFVNKRRFEHRTELGTSGRPSMPNQYNHLKITNGENI